MADNNSNEYWNDNYFYDYQYKRQAFTWALAPNGKSYADAIIKGIMTESSFNYQVSHSYAGNSMMKQLTDFLSGVMNGARNASQAVGTIADTVSKITDSGGFINQLAEKTKQSVKNIESFKLGDTNIAQLMNGSVVSMINQIKYYDGSNIGFSLPKLSTIYFDNDENEDIITRTKRYDTYFIGKLNTLSSQDYGAVANLIGIMEAPSSVVGSAYKPAFGSEKLAEFPGSFRLYLGENYCIKNLVITNYSVELSTTKHRNTGKPLYAEINLSLEPASYVDREVIHNYYITN